ncbi:hypothetical protein MSPGM_00420 [Methylorubrum sp. GM97]|nr:type II secretion system F family protein [Methylorubrum sp. GM97]BDL37452.1 hypothetical protein MSPGM_00420 [Methylorubrum sp. GM97]
MPRYAYQAYAADGRARSGRIEAESRQRAVAQLRADGFQVFAIEPAASGAAPFWSRDLFGRDRVNDAARLAFLREFGTLVGAGLTVDRALRLVERQASAALKPVLADILERVVAGASLSRAMAAHPQAFPRTWSISCGPGRQPARSSRCSVRSPARSSAATRCAAISPRR